MKRRNVTYLFIVLALAVAWLPVRFPEAVRYQPMLAAALLFGVVLFGWLQQHGENAETSLKRSHEQEGFDEPLYVSSIPQAENRFESVAQPSQQVEDVLPAVRSTGWKTFGNPTSKSARSLYDNVIGSSMTADRGKAVDLAFSNDESTRFRVGDVNVEISSGETRIIVPNKREENEQSDKLRISSRG